MQKKIISIILAAVVLAGILSAALPVFAADTTDPSVITGVYTISRVFHINVIDTTEAATGVTGTASGGSPQSRLVPAIVILLVAALFVVFVLLRRKKTKGE